MNGRAYDPQLARFTSPDPFVPAPLYSQSYNRYAYVYNNPLKYTDPSGFEPRRGPFVCGIWCKIRDWLRENGSPCPVGSCGTSGGDYGISPPGDFYYDAALFAAYLAQQEAQGENTTARKHTHDRRFASEDGSGSSPARNPSSCHRCVPVGERRSMFRYRFAHEHDHCTGPLVRLGPRRTLRIRGRMEGRGASKGRAGLGSRVRDFQKCFSAPTKRRPPRVPADDWESSLARHERRACGPSRWGNVVRRM